MCSGAGVCDFNRSTNHVKPPGYNGRLLSPIPSRPLVPQWPPTRVSRGSVVVSTILWSRGRGSCGVRGEIQPTGRYH